MADTYAQTVEWMFSRIPMFQNVGAGAYKPGLQGVLALSEAFGNPHLSLRTIHVGGTNGKGSVSSLLASILQESGLKTGLFTSPHLVDFRERIRIDGKMISEKEVVDFISRFRNTEVCCDPSFFELTTVMAFDHFARHGVDIAVIEVGLGGRLDSTNIISPDLCIITNISFDHTAQLGNTLTAIAAEKAGIIKKHVPAVIGNASGAVRKVFEEKAAAEDSPIIFAADSPRFARFIRTDTEIVYEGTDFGDIVSPLAGDCQPENANTVLTALRFVPGLTPEAVADGFRNVCRNTGLAGRWSLISERPRIICDTGHNSGGWQWLAPRLHSISQDSELHAVIGFVSDKDAGSILAMLPKNAHYYWATPSVARGRDSAEIKILADGFGLPGEAFPSVEEAFNAARRAASPDDTVFVGGSTYVVADLYTLLDK